MGPYPSIYIPVDLSTKCSILALLILLNEIKLSSFLTVMPSVKRRVQLSPLSEPSYCFQILPVRDLNDISSSLPAEEATGG